MREAASSILILAVTMNFLALGSSNLKACIRAAALQGFFVSVFPLFFSPEPTARLVGLVVVAGAVKAFVIPGMLMRALREVHTGTRWSLIWASCRPCSSSPSGRGPRPSSRAAFLSHRRTATFSSFRWPSRRSSRDSSF